MRKLDDKRKNIPIERKTLSTLKNKCKHLIGRILVCLASLRSQKGGTKQGRMCYKGEEPDKNSKSKQQSFRVGKKETFHESFRGNIHLSQKTTPVCPEQRCRPSNECM